MTAAVCPECGRFVASGSRHDRHPSLYVDPIAVERAVMGHKVHLRPIERRAAIQVLTRRGLSARVIAERVGACERTVERCRRRDPVEVTGFGC